MLIEIGEYHLWPKPVAFRNDYCLTCQRERRAIRSRTLDVVHVFYVPVLPVGFWKHWSCSACGRDPHGRRGSRSSLKWFSMLVLIVLALLFWLEPGTPVAVRAIITTLSVLLVLYLLRSPSEMAMREKLAAVPSATDTICPFCQTPMVGGTQWSCPACGVVRC